MGAERAKKGIIGYIHDRC